MKHLVCANTCSIFLHKLCHIKRFVNDLFVLDILSFHELMYLNSKSLGGGIYPKYFCELNCTASSDTCAFLDLKISQSPLGLEVDIYDKRLQKEYAGLKIIRMPHFSSNISISAKYGVIVSQLFRFSRLYSSKISFITQACNLVLLLLHKGYVFKRVMNKVRSFLNRSKFIFGISALGMYKIINNKFNKNGELKSPFLTQNQSFVSHFFLQLLSTLTSLQF